MPTGMQYKLPLTRDNISWWSYLRLLATATSTQDNDLTVKHLKYGTIEKVPKHTANTYRNLSA